VHYRPDLAYIHHHGFSEFAESAAPGIIAMLRGANLPPTALVVDLGCGSGILARELTNAGFAVVGVDASSAMLRLARATAPLARFRRASFASMRIPPCDTILAVGEVLNYGTFADVRMFVANAARALRKGGVLLFDAAERGAYPPHDEHRSGGEDWSVIVIKTSDGDRKLTRRILTFRRAGRSVHRDEEVHDLELYDRSELLALLRQHGFRVKIRRSYRTRRLPPGHAVYIAVHP
jgi:SAM-dependent methyltransferase